MSCPSSWCPDSPSPPAGASHLSLMPLSTLMGTSVPAIERRKEHHRGVVRGSRQRAGIGARARVHPDASHSTQSSYLSLPNQ